MKAATAILCDRSRPGTANFFSTEQVVQIVATKSERPQASEHPVSSRLVGYFCRAALGWATANLLHRDRTLVPVSGQAQLARIVSFTVAKFVKSVAIAPGQHFIFLSRRGTLKIQDSHLTPYCGTL